MSLLLPKIQLLRSWCKTTTPVNSPEKTLTIDASMSSPATVRKRSTRSTPNAKRNSHKNLLGISKPTSIPKISSHMPIFLKNSNSQPNSIKTKAKTFFLMASRSHLFLPKTNLKKNKSVTTHTRAKTIF
jgi:hypothetical protein